MVAKVKSRSFGLNVNAADLPKLDKSQWMRSYVLAGIFLVLALVQLVTFSDFKDALGAMGVTSATEWGICVIIAEVIAALGLVKLPLSFLARSICAVMAILAAGFWFILNLQSISSGLDVMPNLGLFGGVLEQSPCWWTTIETSVLLIWTLHILSLMMPSGSVAKR